REPLFRLFSPYLDIQNWQLILARIEVDFIGELFYGREVEIRTAMSKIGNRSMTLHHEAWQDGKLAAKGTAVMVHFDLKAKQAKTIPETILLQMQLHLVNA